MEHFPRYSKNILLSLQPGKELLSELLRTGKLNEAQSLIDDHPEKIAHLVELLDDSDTAMHVRIGISAIIESLAGRPLLHSIIPALGELLQHAQIHVRIDACYFLGQTHHQDALTWLKQALNDKSTQVRESAQESIEEIG
jgi:HEAT repeat protein